MDNGAGRMGWLREAEASRKLRGLAYHVAKIVAENAVS
jgi:hypothetical protein